MSVSQDDRMRRVCQKKMFALSAAAGADPFFFGSHVPAAVVDDPVIRAYRDAQNAAQVRSSFVSFFRGPC